MKVLVPVRDIHVLFIADVKQFACMLKKRFLNLQPMDVTVKP